MGRLRRQLHEPWGDGRQFGYDGLGRLLADSLLASVDPESCTTTGADPNDEGAECNEQQFALDWEAYWVDSFAYDSAGNRTDHGGTYGPGNRIRAFDNCTYSTDDDGNVTQRSCAGEKPTGILGALKTGGSFLPVIGTGIAAWDAYHACKG